MGISALIGILVILGGIVFGIYTFIANGNKISQMRYIAPSTIDDIADIVDGISEIDSGYRHYVQINGRANCDVKIVAPYSKKEVCYYDNKCYCIREEKNHVHVQFNQNGRSRQFIMPDVQQDIVQTELSRSNSTEEFYITDDSSGRKVFVDVKSFGKNAEFVNVCDRTESRNSSWIAEHCENFNAIRPSYENNVRGYKFIENIIPVGHPLYILGELYKCGNNLYVGSCVKNKQLSFISYKSKEDIISDSRAKRIVGIGIIFFSLVVGTFLIFSGTVD